MSNTWVVPALFHHGCSFILEYRIGCIHRSVWIGSRSTSCFSRFSIGSGPQCWTCVHLYCIAGNVLCKCADANNNVQHVQRKQHVVHTQPELCPWYTQTLWARQRPSWSTNHTHTTSAQIQLTASDHSLKHLSSHTCWVSFGFYNVRLLISPLVIITWRKWMSCVGSHLSKWFN